MITFSPKQRFQKNKDQVLAFAELVNNPLLITGLNDALAEMAFRMTCVSPEQMIGVNNFISIFLNMAEPATPNKPLPEKSLKSWDRLPSEIPPTETK